LLALLVDILLTGIAFSLLFMAVTILISLSALLAVIARALGISSTALRFASGFWCGFLFCTPRTK
jgi:hypothetical protein